MKIFGRIAIASLIASVIATIMVSCSGFNTLSEEEAYNLGYSGGKIIGHYLNN